MICVSTTTTTRSGGRTTRVADCETSRTSVESVEQGGTLLHGAALPAGMGELPARFGGADWLDLGPDEEVLWAGHPSVVPYLGAFVLGAVLIVAGAVGMALLGEYAIVGVAGIAAGIAVAGLAYYRRISTGYVITTAEVYHKEGLIARDVTQIRYERVQNTSFSQSILERALSYGDVIITSAGTGEVEIVLRNVPDPAELKRLLSEQLDDVYTTDTRTSPHGAVRSEL